ncbi:MAG: hypothetical protein KF904_02690 [Rhodoblastus sp.]|nr:hypothetical protein [Rhodoblastus sp.]
MPGETRDPRPVKLLSKKRLAQIWRNSKDARPGAGTYGVDHIDARRFRENLDENLSRLAREIAAGAYNVSRLRPIFIPKPNSTKERLICVPTVRDRLVQRAIIDDLVQKKKLDIYNDISHGFIAGLGIPTAIQAALKFRSTHKYAIKADIQSFFDRIPRDFVKSEITRCLGKSSLRSLLFQMVDSEIKGDPRTQAKLSELGIRTGIGLRQGMPISPLLSNLTLSKFDGAMHKRGIVMVRYADDLLSFYQTEKDALYGLESIKKELGKIGLSVPELSENSKTKIYAAREDIDFLGRIIRYNPQSDEYVCCVGNAQIGKIKAKMSEAYTLKSYLKDKLTITEFERDLSATIASYASIYRDAHDYSKLNDALGRTRAAVRKQLFIDLFGLEVAFEFSKEQRRFLGLSEADLTKLDASVEL